MHWLSWEPLCEPNFLCISILRVASGHRVKLASCKSALNPRCLVVYSTDHSKAVVPVLVLLIFALWFILRGDCFVLPCVILFLCFSVLLALRLPRLGKRELILLLVVRLFDLYLFGFVGFVFLLVSGKGCGCDCGTPWTFLLPSFNLFLCTYWRNWQLSLLHATRLLCLSLPLQNIIKIFRTITDISLGKITR